METAEQIRIQMAQMRLAALETDYCNANWTFNMKLKTLKEELHSKNRKQIELEAQLAALRLSYAEHQNQIQNLMTQAAQFQQQPKCQQKRTSNSPNLHQTMSRNSPKHRPKGLFFRVVKDEKKRLNFSPQITQTPATTSWCKIKSTNDATCKNPQKSNTVVLLKENNSLRSFGSEKTFESSTTVEVKRGSPNITKRIEDKNINGRQGRKRQQKWGKMGP